MSKKLLINVVMISAIVIAAGFLVAYFSWTQNSVDGYRSYNDATRQRLMAIQNEIKDVWGKEPKERDDYDRVTNLAKEQISFLSTRSSEQPSLASGPLILEETVDRESDIATLQGISALYEEIRDRMEVESRSKSINLSYEKSSQTLEDYTNAMRQLAGLADSQSQAPYANDTDRALAEQYSIVVDELARAERAYSLRDRPAYDRAQSKIDQADESIRSMNSDIKNHFQKLLDSIDKKIVSID